MLAAFVLGLGLAGGCSKPSSSSTAGVVALEQMPPLAASAALSPSDDPNQSAVPVLVELFSSEGCSSCPPAERVLGDLLEHPPHGTRVVPIEFHVDYWDYIGHVDRFGSPAFTERQKAYAEKLHTTSLYTPQAVVDGQNELVGSRKAALTLAIEEAAKRPHIRVKVLRESDRCRVTVGPLSSPTERAKVMLVEVAQRPSTKVVRGENAGSTLEHTWVATRLMDLGEVDSAGGVTSSPPLRAAQDSGVVAFVVRVVDGVVLGTDSLRDRPSPTAVH